MLKLIKVGFNGLKNEILYKLDMPFSLGLSKPTTVCLLVTRRCNFKCRYCSPRRVNQNQKELSIHQWKKIILKLRGWIGPFYMVISGGGEPLIRKDIPSLVKFANKRGIVTDIATNGSFIDARMAKSLVNSGLDKITFSLNSANPLIHDDLRGFDGSFDRIMAAIKTLRSMSPNLNIALNTVVTSKNLDDFESLLELAKKNTVTGVHFIGLYNNCYNDLWPDYNKSSRSIKRVIELKSKGYPVSDTVQYLHCLQQYFKNPSLEFNNLRCFSPLRFMCVSPEGRTWICDTPIGDLTLNQPKELWHSRESEAIREQKKRCTKSCILVSKYNFVDSISDQFKMFYGAFKKSATFR